MLDWLFCLAHPWLASCNPFLLWQHRGVDSWDSASHWDTPWLAPLYVLFPWMAGPVGSAWPQYSLGGNSINGWPQSSLYIDRFLFWNLYPAFNPQRLDHSVDNYDAPCAVLPSLTYTHALRIKIHFSSLHNEPYLASVLIVSDTHNTSNSCHRKIRHPMKKKHHIQLL